MQFRLSLGALIAVGSLFAADQPIPTSRSAQAMSVPEGFRVQLAAGEPTIVQPIAFTFDDRGRLWVVECLSYPKWSRDGKGQDRVVILEDPDEQGTYRKRTVVLDNGVNLSGLELGFGGLYLCSTPNLIFIPLKDDKPADEPRILLDGWNLNDAKHNVFNSLIWGPDGWLYGCNGIQTRSWVGKPGTPHEQRTFLDCGVWRFHPTRHTFEVVAVGTTNPWGLDWDDRGEMFITNCVIDHLWHLHPGGRYQRMYGQDSNPYSYGHMGPSSDHKHWGGGNWTESRADRKTGAIKKEHDDAGGGHAHSGCAIYLGNNFPPEYRNRVFMCNIHGNRLNQNRLSYESQSTVIGKRLPDFLFANDPWFRGICVKVGPEGALYVSDWCDTGECHNYDVADTSNGRIYRVTYGDGTPFRGDVSQFSDAELINAQLSANEWLVRQARRVLHERLASGGLTPDAAKMLRALRQQKLSPQQLLRVSWTLALLGDWQRADSEVLIRVPECAAWAVRLANNADDILSLVFVAPMSETHRVRAAAATVMMKLPAEQAYRVATNLFQVEAQTADANLVQLYWLGLQPHLLTHPERALKLINEIRLAPIQTNIVRLVATLPNTEITKQLDKVLAVLEQANTESARLATLKGMLQALEGYRQVGVPSRWEKLYPILSQSDHSATLEVTETLALLLGDQRVIQDLTKRMTDRTAPADQRQRAIARLSQQKQPDLPGTLLKLLDDPAVRGASIRGLSHYNEARTPEVLVSLYAKLNADEQADMYQTLASRPTYALHLLKAIEQGRVPKADLTPFTARQIQSLNDNQLKQKLEQVWGVVRPASATRVQETKRWKEHLTPQTMKEANASAGRLVYQQNCASCHKLFGEGGDVGPELTGSQRANLDYLLENVLDPSAVVPSEWRMSIFNLIDGRTLTGIIRKETPQAVTIRTLNEEVVVPKDDIESRKPTNLSIMPDGLFEKLSREQVRDIVAYLASREQVPLPATNGSR